MSKLHLREQFAYNFQTALENAGMQDGSIDDSGENKPKYWRGETKDITDENLFLVYNVSTPTDTENADNRLFRQQLFADGKLCTSSLLGYSDGDFQDLADKIEEECEKLGIFISWQYEGEYELGDSESLIYYYVFEAQQRLLNKKKEKHYVRSYSK